MSFDVLMSNINREKEIIDELNNLSGQVDQLNKAGSWEDVSREKSLIESSTEGLFAQFEALNNALPDLLAGIKFYKGLEDKSKSVPVKNVLSVKYKHPQEQDHKVLGIRKKDQFKFLKGVTKTKEVAKKIEKPKNKVVKKNFSAEKRLSSFIGLSNKYFRKISDDLVEKKHFTFLNRDLRKITSPLLLNSYLSMMFFTVVLSGILGLFISVVLFVFGFYLTGVAVFFILPASVFVLFITYPGFQKNSLEKEINQELPFVTIYMSAVATSGIEPSKIFDIIVRTKDYPFTKREIKKLLNYVNFYGYDLVSALRESSKTSPSERLGMLFNGLSSTIRGGGELTDFLNKHAETLLFDYRLEREKYTKIAETFMDIYISIVIAAPMIMMILFVLISITGYGSAYLTPNILSLLIIFIVTVLNLGFLVFLNMRQPKF